MVSSVGLSCAAPCVAISQQLVTGVEFGGPGRMDVLR